MLKVGDKVVCQIYNTPEQKFYGDEWTAEIISIDRNSPKPYTVTWTDSHPTISLHRNEIRRKQ